MNTAETNRECERCRAEFRCGANEGDCWCFALSVSADARIEIGKNFADCLCKDCLATYAEQHS
jgi:hypothetical protein